MNMRVDWDIDCEDIGLPEIDNRNCFKIITINTNEDTKEIWSVTYSYIWDCGDGCCSDTETDVAYIGQLSNGIKEQLLEKLPDYKLQKLY